MRAFSALSPEQRLLIAGLFFAAVTGELFLIMYRHYRASGFRLTAGEILEMLTLFLLLDYLTIRAGAEEGQIRIGIPWILTVLPSLFLAFYALIRFRMEWVSVKNSLSPMSVRQALDDFGTGICYSDSAGRIVLMNRAMREMVSEVSENSGELPQTMDEIRKTLEGFRDPETDDIYRLGKSRIFRIRSGEMDSSLSGFVRMTAQDVTELYRAADVLEEENRKLEETNARMRTMFDRLSDRVREQEALELKMKVHNEIGSSLISISELMEKGASRDLDAQMRVLRNAVSYFTGERTEEPKSFEEICLQAAELGVALKLEGSLPEDSAAAALTALAARECVTNCIRHAKGSEVRVRISVTDHGYRVSITNDGLPPAGPIREGGGLSALRRSVEEAGGSMRILDEPGFELLLELPEADAEQNTGQ